MRWPRMAQAISSAATGSTLRIGELPTWLGRPDLYRSHQSSLLRKDPAHYRPIFGNDVPDDLPYVWPVSDRSA